MGKAREDHLVGILGENRVLADSGRFWQTVGGSDLLDVDLGTYIDMANTRRIAASVASSGMHPLFSDARFPAQGILSPCSGVDYREMQVNMFGGLTVKIEGEPIDDGRWCKLKSKLLFAHLVTRFGREVSRDTLLSLLWPGMEKQRAIKNLYVVGSAMRRAVRNRFGESPYVVVHGEMYRIEEKLVWSDIAEFEELSRRALFENMTQDDVGAIFERIDRLYTGDLLAGIKCDPHLMRMRNRYRDTYVDVLLTASNVMAECGNASGALWYSRKALEVDVGREDVYQSLMLAQKRAGQRTSAMETFFVCKEYLDVALGIPLSRKTLDIYQSLLDDD